MSDKKLELMAFGEAALKMKTGDLFNPADHSPAIILNEDKSFSLERGGAMIMMSQQYLKLTGVIIPAEPVVLSAEEYLYKKYPYPLNKEHGTDKNVFPELCVIYEDGTTNGQIKERRNLQPLIDAVAILDEKSIHNQLSSVTVKVITEYRKIKPLEPSHD